MMCPRSGLVNCVTVKGTEYISSLRSTTSHFSVRERRRLGPSTSSSDASSQRYLTFLPLPHRPSLPPNKVSLLASRLNSRLLSCICSLHLLACVALLVPEHTKTLQTKGQPPKGPFHHQASQLTYPPTPPLVSLFFTLSHSHTPHLQPHPQTPYPFLQASSSLY